MQFAQRSSGTPRRKLTAPLKPLPRGGPAPRPRRRSRLRNSTVSTDAAAAPACDVALALRLERERGAGAQRSAYDDLTATCKPRRAAPGLRARPAAAARCDRQLQLEEQAAALGGAQSRAARRAPRSIWQPLAASRPRRREARGLQAEIDRINARDRRARRGQPGGAGGADASRERKSSWTRRSPT